MAKESKVFYTCVTDWNHELGETTTRLYKTIKDLKKSVACLDECGIIRLTIIGKVLKTGTLYKKRRK